MSRRYLSADEDSARWTGFQFRDGDIVISTRSKSGTTWTQMICALLIFQTPSLPAPMRELSPWLDWLGVPLDSVYERLATQPHRRFIKTHTPLDGVPADPRVTYIVVGRHPLDMAASLYHQSRNIDRARLHSLTGQSTPSEPAIADQRLLREWLLSWIERDVSPDEELDSLPGVMWHLTDAWVRENVVLVHYEDLLADLDGQMRRLAKLLGIAVPWEAWPELVAAATFSSMRARSDQLSPAPPGLFKDNAAFFRRGTSGSGRSVLTRRELDRYHVRALTLAPPDVVAWLHRLCVTEHVEDAAVRIPYEEAANSPFFVA